MDILINKMKFHNAPHEQNTYFRVINSQEVLACQQVDDFAVGALDPSTCKLFVEEIRKHVKAEYAAMGMETSQGFYQRYNGVDIIQTHNYVKVGCESYIDRILQTHGWESLRSPTNLVLTL